ncbi:nucleotidyltransferase family protein [Pseudomonas protegens]|uniref:nucleotidyltransferase family protein n=1 Tax=Pseudomonas protegens TaxID=380021 RepID=UPI000C9C5869|nr:nucleotidyltransferase family protein [Pseudomonas protegens]AXK56996.1 hypothetical protein DWF74_27925 [Pseudomonas protegens]MCL9657685.1 nucleotidyltransferase family protein [Pseudomonas protegens]
MSPAEVRPFQEPQEQQAARVGAIIAADPLRWQLLQQVQALGLDDCWIGAGFVRNAVWDHLHGRACSPLDSDVDVIWFDRQRCSAELDRQLEEQLRASHPGVDWSVKNQARMHLKNGDRPYLSSADAMTYWPETATAVAVRLGAEGACEVCAPLGLDDLLRLLIRPTTGFVESKRPVFLERLRSKNWQGKWPLLRLEQG